jgi:hypothetical protein
MKIKLLFAFVLSISLVTVLGTVQPIPDYENLGVVWSDGGHTLKVLFRDGNDYFVREWDFSGKGEDLEVFPFDGNRSGFSSQAFAVGVEADLVGDEIFVFRVNNADNSGQQRSLIRTVYGYAFG